MKANDPDRNLDHKVIVLMATFNGRAHLVEQLNSIANQTHTNWELWVSDDGSTDDTKELVTEFLTKHPGRLFEGPQQGANSNFLNLINEFEKNGEDAWLAFADQDDIWLSNRLTLGLNALGEVSENIPALFCSRTWIADRKGRPKKLSRLHARPPSFRNALVQNIAAGNTLLLNPMGARTLGQLSLRIGGYVVHDWWTYLVVTGVGGHVVFDPEPTLYYRQHDKNEIGENRSFLSTLSRISKLFDGTVKEWNSINLAALERVHASLSEENQTLLKDYSLGRNGTLRQRLRMIGKLGLYRQTSLGTLAIWVAAIWGKL